MEKHCIQNIPRYFEPHVSDCFQNAVTPLLSHLGVNVNFVLADYLSFLYDRKNGHIGVNYLYKYNTSVEFTEEELNTSLEFVYFPQPVYFDSLKPFPNEKQKKDKINLVMFMGEAEEADDRVKELIHQGIPAVLAIDLFYMPYHRSCGKEHGLHYVVVTGFDDEEQVYYIFDKYKLSSSDFDGKVSYEIVRKARESENPQSNALVSEYRRPIQRIWVEAAIGCDFKITKEGILSLIRESIARMKGQKTVLGTECGTGVLEQFRNDIVHLINSEDLQNTLNLFRVYYNESFKTIARSRKRYVVFLNEAKTILSPDTLELAIECLSESSKHWDIAANLSLKYAITKKTEIIGDIYKQLGNVIEKENIAINILESLC